MATIKTGVSTTNIKPKATPQKEQQQSYLESPCFFAFMYM